MTTTAFEIVTTFANGTTSSYSLSLTKELAVVTIKAFSLTSTPETLKTPEGACQQSESPASSTTATAEGVFMVAINGKIVA